MKELICILGNNKEAVDNLIDDIRERLGYKHVTYVVSTSHNGIENDCVVFKPLNTIHQMRYDNNFSFSLIEEVNAFCILKHNNEDIMTCVTNAGHVGKIIEGMKENNVKVTVVNIVNTVDDVTDTIVGEYNKSLSVYDMLHEHTREEFESLRNSNIVDITIENIESRDDIFLYFLDEYLSKDVLTLDNLDKESIKYVFVDFDNTACLHNWLEASDKLRQCWNRELFARNADWYIKKFYAGNRSLGILLEEFKDVEAKIICLTWTDDTVNVNAKKMFLDVEYPGIFNDYIATGSRSGKIAVINKYINSLGVDPDSILVIDDHPDTLNECRVSKIKAISPVAIQDYVLKKYAKGKII